MKATSNVMADRKKLVTALYKCDLKLCELGPKRIIRWKAAVYDSGWTPCLDIYDSTKLIWRHFLRYP